MAVWAPASDSAHNGQRMLKESNISQYNLRLIFCVLSSLRSGELLLRMLPVETVRPGVWYWKDDTNTLEFASSSPAAEKNLKEGKNTLFQEIRVRTLKRNEKPDDFLMALLFYISFYLEKIALEKKYRSLTSTMISFEKTEMDNVLEKLAMSRIHLAKVYCNLILGRGMAQQSSGKEKPSLQKDRSYFEGLYNFSSYVAWLVFRRKHFQVIREEISRLLCSDMFNPALRGQKNIELQKPGDGTSDANTVQLTYPRKDRGKHPSISTMIQERSPVLSTLLPLPKDNAQYLFQNHDCQARDPHLTCVMT